MATTIEPIQSFAHLCENVPQWLTKLEELNAHCDEQYERFYKLTKHGEVKLTRKKKHDSTESLRPHDNIPIPLLQPKDPKETIPALATDTAPLAEITRTPPVHTSAALTSNKPTLKRKQASNLSAASGRDGYRTKSMIVVYYDSAIQQSFESMVKNVSSARSNLRKGRTTATFQARMASMALPSEHSDTLSSSKLMMPSFGRVKEDVSEKQKYKVYDEVDRDLEEAQNLSEKAAHQFLRDGDCNIEIGAMRKRFRAVKDLAEQEFERLKRKEDSTERIEASKPAAEEDVDRTLDTSYPKLPMTVSPLAPIEVEMLPPKQMYFAATGAIEVDDAASDGSSIKIDMDAVRRVTRRAI